MDSPDEEERQVLRLLKCTYFIQDTESRNHLIKIGRSLEPIRRLNDLQNSSPVRLRLIGLVLEDIEGKLHTRFKEQRQHGEWFRPTRALLKFIKKYERTAADYLYQMGETPL